MWFKFFVTRYFWVNLLLAALVLVIIGIIANLTLGVVTRHGEELKVPDLKGVALKKAIEILEQKGLKYQIRDSVFMDNMPRMSIVEQSPEAEENVKQGRIIYITVNALDVPQVLLNYDHLRGSGREVKTYIESMGLKVGTVQERKGSYDNVVMDVFYKGQKIVEDIELPKGSKIDMTIEVTKLSKEDGEEETSGQVQIPDLSDLSVDEAKDQLKALGLSLGQVMKANDKVNISNATIYKQKPSYKKKKEIAVGSEIDVWVK